MARWQWSCATNLWAAHDLKTALDQIAGLEFGYVDLWASPIAPHVDLKRDKPEALRRMLADRGLHPSALTIYFTTTEDKLRSIELAAAIGAPCIVFEPGPSADFHDRLTNLQVRGLTVGEPGEGMDRFAERLTGLVQAAKEAGVRVALEVPHVYTVTETAADVEQLLQLVPDENLTLTLAPPHVLARGGTIEGFLRRFASRTDLFYLWDVRPDYDAAKHDRAFGGGEHQTPGNGSLDFVNVFAWLTAAGFAGRLDVKCHGTEPWTDAERVTSVVRTGVNAIETRLAAAKVREPVPS